MLNHLIDITFALDIILNFRTTYMNRMTGEEITGYKEIQINYIKGQFAIDLLSTIPFDVVISWMISEDNNSNNL